MNKFITDINGKLPFVLDDLRFSDDAYRMAFTAIAKAMAKGENLILYGLDETNNGGDNYTYSQGVVILNDEILFVDETTLDVVSGKKAVINKEESWDSAGKKLFGDDTLKDTYKIVKGIIQAVEDETTPNSVEVTARNVEDTPYVDGHGEWQNVTYEDSYWSNGSVPLKFRKLANGMLHIKGIAHLSDNAYSLIFILPEAFRPIFNRLIYVGVGTSESYINRGASITINNTGDGFVKVEFMSGATTDKVGYYLFDNIIDI